MKTNLIRAALVGLLCLTVAACGGQAHQIQVNKSVVGFYATVSAPESNNTPTVAAGAMTANASVTDLETSSGELIESTWSERGADGSMSRLIVTPAARTTGTEDAADG